MSRTSSRTGSRPSSRTGSSSVYSDDHHPPSNRRLRIATHTGEPPLYQVDLSLPPESRYSIICKHYQDEMAELVKIYDDILSLTPSPRLFAFVAKILLRKVFTKEETEEIRGISKATEIPIHLVVAYNTFLDLFSGCISGGVQVNAPFAQGKKMLHFRNLDWNMDPLRDMIIRVEYLIGGKVVARAVTYAGYVGVEGLSVSLNYRARVQSKSSKPANGLHYFLILLGRRPSIASQLRQILLSPGTVPTLEELSDKFNRTKSSSCYLTFCTLSSVLVVEKGLNSAVTHSSEEFLAVTNHDRAMEDQSPEQWQELVSKQLVPELQGVHDMLEESLERKECMCNLWRSKGVENISLQDVKTWLRTYPIRNECTHFSCIMDPSAQGGGLVWVETCEEG
ncbi:beta subunit of N-acylethanolamine-hydrolyzing acid amidase-domain-containing protein [Flammula alnicola]|nr:beta subunit of N-acylethanolamine-hydrolyzing acid amidase-domain-containing protein [Flammula alnicola]